MKLNITTSELNKFIRIHLIESITPEDNEGYLIESPTIHARINYAKERFNSEMGYLIPRIGRQPAINEWLQGLAINIEYNNYNIVEMYKKWGAVNSDLTDDDRIDVVAIYWDSLAFNLSGLFRGYRIPKTLEA